MSIETCFVLSRVRSITFRASTRRSDEAISFTFLFIRAVSYILQINPLFFLQITFTILQIKFFYKFVSSRHCCVLIKIKSDAKSLSRSKNFH